ncbi:MAG TPA: spore germination protein GerPC [Bacilli bacterium]
MLNAQEFFRMVQWMAQHFAWQEERLAEITRTLNRLEQDLTALKQQKETRIGRVEYKFDQLKVEKLEGTLNVGMSTPGGAGEIGQLAAPGNAADDPHDGGQTAPNDENDAAALIRAETDRYARDELPATVRRMADHHGIAMDNSFHGMITEDVKRQLQGRVPRYAEQAERLYGKSVESAQLRMWIARRIKEDVEEGLRRYFVRIGQQREAKE